MRLPRLRTGGRSAFETSFTQQRHYERRTAKPLLLVGARWTSLLSRGPALEFYRKDASELSNHANFRTEPTTHSTARKIGRSGLNAGAMTAGAALMSARRSASRTMR